MTVCVIDLIPLDVLHLQHLSGSKRLTRLHSAVMNGKDGPDVDLRYIKKPMSLVGISQDTVRSDIVSFLSSLYDSVAETLPDVRDTAFDGIEAADIPSIGHMDSYCIELNRQSAENFEEADENHISTRRRSLLFPHAKGKAKPRKKRKALELNMDRTHGPGERHQVSTTRIHEGILSAISNGVQLGEASKLPFFLAGTLAWTLRNLEVTGPG